MPPILHFAQPASDRQLPASPAFSLQQDPLAAGRRLQFHDARMGCVSGVARSIGADVRVDDYPWVELSLIEAGQLRLEGDGYCLDLGPGDIVVVPRGAAVRWQHQGELLRTFMVFTGRACEGPMPTRAVKIDPNVTLAPSNPPAAAVLLSDAPTTHNDTQFESGGCLRIGIWSSTPYARKLVEPGFSEFMFFYEGAVTFDTPSGERVEVKAGEAILIPAGGTNAWTNDVYVRKLFCILSA